MHPQGESTGNGINSGTTRARGRMGKSELGFCPGEGRSGWAGTSLPNPSLLLKYFMCLWEHLISCDSSRDTVGFGVGIEKGGKQAVSTEVPQLPGPVWALIRREIGICCRRA